MKYILPLIFLSACSMLKNDDGEYYKTSHPRRQVSPLNPLTGESTKHRVDFKMHHPINYTPNAK